MRRGTECDLSAASRGSLSEIRARRLGSTTSDAGGEFTIRHEADGEGRRFSWARDVNLWLAISACRSECQEPEFIYRSKDVRYCAADHEEYVICLAADYEDVNNRLGEAEQKPTVESIEASHEEKERLKGIRHKIAEEKHARREALRADFRNDIAPEFARRMSLVERDKNGDAVDNLYVPPGESVRKASEAIIKTRLSTDLDTSVERSKRFSLSGRVSLTAEQLSALKARKIDAESDDDGFGVSEEDLQAVLMGDGGSGLNPQADGQIVDRVDAIKAFCRDRTKGEHCLSDETDPVVVEVGDNADDEGGHGDDGTDGEPAVGDGLESDTGDRMGDNVSLETLKESIPTYIAKVLDESSVLDPGNSQLPTPGSRLDEEGIEAAASFPSLTLPPGPADVPAFYDFYDLQIAFSEIWQEALDESVLGDIEAIYEKYVEAGGAPANFVTTVVKPTNVVLTGFSESTINVDVQRHITIDTREWGALTQEQQVELANIASDIDERLSFLYGEKLQRNVFTDGVTDGDLKTFTRTKEYVMSRVDELRDQAERIVASARKELERQAAGKSIVPNSGILKQLRSRLQSAYPAKYFAANKLQRSVNFGLMLTYRQRWTPTAYQVGELIKSVPLAPKEVRKYSKKVVRTRRRSKKEIESNLESLKSETNSTTRAEAEIVQDAMDKTNFNASANGSFTVGVWSGGGSSSLTQDTSSKSAETKKRMHEAVVKAAREYRNEIKVELTTEESFEEEFQESGEMTNWNENLTVTYLFYELQRRYRVEERLHRMMSVVLVAQEMPSPADIDEDWLIANRWILNRVLLDDGLKQPLYYVAEGMVAEQFALEEARKSLEQQRRIVEELKEDVADSRILTESRYAALQRSMERSARAAQRKSRGGGLLGFAKKLTAVGVVGDLVDRFIGGEDETPEAARVREAAAQDAYQREMQKLRDLEAQMAQMNTTLSRATEEFSDRLGAHLGNVVRVTELKNHVKDNITHYMQSIWMHEPFQQRWLRLKDVPVPVLKRADAIDRLYKIKEKAITGSLANVTHLKTAIHEYTVWPEIKPPARPTPTAEPELETVPLYRVADIDDLIGFRANYMIFPMKEANALTDFMMEPYVERAGGAFGITDPDELGNMNLDDFGDYVCCLKEHLEEDDFQALVPELTQQLKKLLQSPLRDDEEIVVPMDAMYIEALPGSRPILEDFKLLHRQIDAADAQEDLRLKKMEKIRYAQRLLEGRTDDPEADARYEFTGNPEMDFAVSQPGGESGGGGSGEDGP